jgi:tetratricopeptide (TPR) repeat protein
MPANDTAPANPEASSASGTRRKSRPELEPVRLDDDLLPRAKTTPELSNMAARGFSRDKLPARLDPVPQPTAQRPRSRPELKPVELPEEPVTVPPAPKPAAERVLAGIGGSAAQQEASAQGRVLDRRTFGDQPTDPSMQMPSAALLEQARRPDMPSAAEPPAPPAAPAKAGADKLDSLMDMAPEQPSALADDTEARAQAITRPFDTSSLMAAIEEEEPFSGDEGARQILDAVVRKRVQEETLIVVRREQRKSRAIMLFMLFLVAAGEYFALRYFDEHGHRNEQAAPALRAPKLQSQPNAEAPPTPPAQAEEQATAQAAPTPEAEPQKPNEKPAAAQPEPKAEAQAKPEPNAEVEAKPKAEAQAKPEPTAPAPAPSQDGAGGPPAGASSDQLVRDGTQLLSNDNAALARTYFLQATVADPKNAHAFSGLAEAELALGEHREGLQHIEQAIKLRPKRARYRVTQGDLLKALGKTDEAQAAYQKGLEIDPDDREAKRRLGL